MPRPKQADPLARRQILAAALTVFSRTGYAGTTLDDITAEANLSKGAIYWYFDNKADLFATLLGERASIFSELLEDAAKRASGPLGGLEAMWLRWLGALENDPGYQAYARRRTCAWRSPTSRPRAWRRGAPRSGGRRRW